jgi:hypothetical protein
MAAIIASAAAWGAVMKSEWPASTEMTCFNPARAIIVSCNWFETALSLVVRI